jgi:hypothetical protein
VAGDDPADGAVRSGEVEQMSPLGIVALKHARQGLQHALESPQISALGRV